MNGLEMFFNAVEVLAYVGIACVVSGMFALVMWSVHAYLTKVRRSQLPISTEHIEQYKANRECMMLQARYLTEPDTIQCMHGRGPHEYCEPCGRTTGQ